MCVLYFTWHRFCIRVNGHRSHAAFHVGVLLVRTCTVTSYKIKRFGDWIDVRSQAIGCGGMASTQSEQGEWDVLSLE